MNATTNTTQEHNSIDRADRRFDVLCALREQAEQLLADISLARRLMRTNPEAAPALVSMYGIWLDNLKLQARLRGC